MSGRRLAPVATAVAAAAICGALFAPATAFATPTGSTLQLAISGVSQNGIARGQDAKTFTVTVTNPSDTAQDYTGLAFGDPSGPSPVLGSQVLFTVEPITAPATDSETGQEDNSVMEMFYPHGGTPSSDFSVPAKSSYSWKVTFGFRQDYPLNDDGITLGFDTGRGSETVHFDVPPGQPAGELADTFGPKATVAPGKPADTWLKVKNTAGPFDVPLRSVVDIPNAVPGLTLEVKDHSTWVKLAASGNSQWELPQIPSGLGHDETFRYDLRFTVPDGQGKGSARDLPVEVHTGLAKGNLTPISHTSGVLHYDPAAAATPTHSATPTSTAPAGSAPTTGASAPSTAPTTAATNAPVGQLAETGSSKAGLFAAMAAVLAAAGAALLATGARRRRATH